MEPLTFCGDRNANFSGSFAGKDTGVMIEPVSTVGQLEDLLQQLEEGDSNQVVLTTAVITSRPIALLCICKSE